MKNIKIISVDFQKEFTSEQGKWFNPGNSIKFMKDTLFPFLKENNIKIFEIVSDYRQPRLGDSGDGCYPGQDGYKSEVPDDIKNQNVWVKSMNSPIWVRKNVGRDKKPGIPYQDSKKFAKWLNKNIGKPDETEVILIGLTVDCCLLCTAQELTWRGYTVKILKEATDPVGGSEEYKKQIITSSPLLNWASVIDWKQFKNFF